jgi:transaldolase
MKIFIDSANIEEIKAAAAWGIVDGVTSNPSLVAKTGRSFNDFINEVFAIIDGPISLEVVATDYEGMLAEGRKLAAVHKNAIVKLPCTPNGIHACKTLSGEGIRVNVTLVFSVSQALVSAKAGAHFISPFAGRLDDIGVDGAAVVADIVTMIKNYGFSSQVLFASVRNVEHIRRAVLMGCHIATVPFKVIEELFKHDLTDKGLEKFLEDWKASGQEKLV